MNLAKCFKISHLIIPSHPLHPSPAGTWTWPIVLRSLIWSSHPILFICLQLVRELGQLFYDLSSDHPIPSSSSISREYVTLVNCFKVSHRIIPFHPLHPSPDRMWTWSIFLRSLIWSSHPILFIRLQNVCDLGQLFKISHLIIPSHPLHPSPGSTWTWSYCIKVSYLIIPSHPLHPSPDRMWTWSIVLRSLIWSSHPILFIRLQNVCELGQMF